MAPDRIRSVLLRGGKVTTVDSSESNADATADGDPVGHSDPYADLERAHAHAHAYGPHDAHAIPAPGCSLCDTVASAYANRVPERSLDDLPRYHGMEAGRGWNAGLREQRPAGPDGDRRRNDNEEVQVGGGPLK